ncbi:MAG: biopolymer transporter ExbD [Verrucomicrobia bacterium]|nr:biopolymer transporter ExbD [Verrucomicrobiota bacterium]
MSSGGGAPGPHKKARIEIIPLIDIMFFLLASFMLVSLSLVKLQGAKVDLPSAGKPLSEDIKKPDFTTVSVDKDGKLFWTTNGSKDKEEITMIDLGKRARELYAKSRQTNPPQEAKVFIAGDEHVNYGVMLGVMDKLRKSGLTKVTFAVKSPAPGASSDTGGGAPATNP